MLDNSNNRLIGVILCGGISSRMGRDKGLLVKDSFRWFKIGFNLLSKVFPQVVVSVNDKQFSEYQKICPNIEYIIDSIEYAYGPLKGILSVNQKYPQQNLFVLACDMIFMRENVIRNLVSIYDEYSGNEIFIYQNEQYLEPLCGIYTVESCKKLTELLKKSNSHNFAIHRLLSNFKLSVTCLEEKEKKSFANINTPKDIVW